MYASLILDAHSPQHPSLSPAMSNPIIGSFAGLRNDPKLSGVKGGGSHSAVTTIPIVYKAHTLLGLIRVPIVQYLHMYLASKSRPTASDIEIGSADAQ